MPIGWGPASDMTRTVNKQRANSVKRSLKESSASTLQGDKVNNQPLKYKEASPELLAQIRADLQKEKKRKMRTTLVMAAVILAVVIYVLLQPVYS